MSDDLPPPPEKLDVVRITKADGCVWEYRVRNLRLEYIGVPEGQGPPGEPLGSLELEADDVMAMTTCAADEAPRPSPPYDHLSLRVRDLVVSQGFYLAALQGLGFEALFSFPDVVGMGPGGRACLWLAAEPEAPSTHVHLCFEASSREQVEAFHAAALTAGGTCNGPPGLRPRFHAGYFAAFVIDPDGNNLEVVCHERAAE